MTSRDRAHESCYLFLAAFARISSFAFSSSRFRVGDRPLPERLMKYCIMRMPEPMPLGLTFLLDITLAIVAASLVKVPSGGKVETVFTFWTHFFLAAMVVSSL